MLPTSSLVVERTKENLKVAGLAVRCSVIKGSFFESIPAGADAYLFRHIIHDSTDEQCIQILGHCRKVIPANGKLLIVDCVVPAGNAPSVSKTWTSPCSPCPAARNDTAAQFRSLLKASGFELKSITPTTTMISVVDGKPV
ncbi:MAG TPA: methyltransferase [Candidatus Acidoferrum sp.]